MVRRVSLALGFLDELFSVERELLFSSPRAFLGGFEAFASSFDFDTFALDVFAFGALFDRVAALLDIPAVTRKEKVSSNGRARTMRGPYQCFGIEWRKERRL